MNIADSIVTDMNILHITECFSPSSVTCVVLLCPTPKRHEKGPALRAPTCSGLGVVVVVVVVVVDGLDFPGPPSAGPPLHWTSLRRTAQNFALFFPLPPHFAFFVSLWVSFR